MNLIRTLLVLAAPAAFAQTTTTTHSSSYPPVGLAPTETLQLNLLNRASASSTGTAASCTGSVSFTNAGGTAVGTAQSYTVAGGQIVSIKLPFTSSGATARAEFVATVTQTTSNAPCALSTTLEVYGTSDGVTHLHLDGADTHSGFGGR